MTTSTALFIISFFVTVVNLLTAISIMTGNQIKWPRYKWISMTQWYSMIPSALYQIWFWFSRCGVI